tara:strand:+ start:934 stop:1761 length:828 start_codon:yes stop_codon:yes gene_type:complete
MPIQKKKKKKPKAKKEKTPAVSQKVTQIVRVNVGDVKPKPRRRRAPAKKPAQPFGFGGGGGGSGLAQVVSAPSATNEVLQQSKELREIVNKLQTSPAQQTLLGSEQGGQQERAIMPEEQPVTRGQFTNIMGHFIGHQGEQMALAGERLEAVRQAVHALAQPTQEAEVPITELHDPAQNPSSTLVEPPVTTPMRMGRGKARTSEQNQSDLDKWAASGLSQKDFAQQQGISYNTLATIARPHGGITLYRRSKGLSTKKKKRGKASESSDSGDETDFP